MPNKNKQEAAETDRRTRPTSRQSANQRIYDAISQRWASNANTNKKKKQILTARTAFLDCGEKSTCGKMHRTNSETMLPSPVAICLFCCVFRHPVVDVLSQFNCKLIKITALGTAAFKDSSIDLLAERSSLKIFHTFTHKTFSGSD